MGSYDSPLLRKFQVVVPLGTEERSFIQALEKDRRPISARTDLVKQGERYQRIGIMQSGWAIRYKTLSDGRRHVVNFVLPGDSFGMFANLFEVADNSVTMLTDGQISLFEPEAIVEAFRTFPKVAAAFTWFGAREEAMIAERAAGLGQRTAYERMAHILLELHRRLETVNMTDHARFDLPVTQEILADTLGLSLVHANRTLRKLRESGLIDLDGQTIHLLDIPRLSEIADFDDLYLHLRRMSKRVVQQFEAD